MEEKYSEETLRKAKKHKLHPNFFHAGEAQEKHNKRIYSILQYLNQGNVRQNSSLTDAELKTQFDFTSTEFDSAFKAICDNKYIYRREKNGIAISEDGERILNEWRTRYELSEISDTTKKTLNLTSVLGLVGTLILFAQGFLMYQQNKLLKDTLDIQKLQYQQQVKQDSLSNLNHHSSLITKKKSHL